MKSPFPGMDPYLEQHWRDVHDGLVVYSRDEIQDQLPGDLRARVNERVFVESESGARRYVYPDVRVIERRGGGTSYVAEGGTALAEPLVIHLADETATESYIEIIDVGSGRRVVTVIEFVSLSNKQPGEGQRQYLQKQREVRDSSTSLVEIDLLRAGERVLSVPDYLTPPEARTPYRVCIRRGWKPFEAEVYPIPIRERLPIIRIPLRETDADAKLDLQAVIERCYRNGAYDDLDYSVEPDPPLEPGDAEWAAALLRALELRAG